MSTTTRTATPTRPTRPTPRSRATVAFHAATPTLALGLAAALLALSACAPTDSGEPFSVVEATIPEMQAAMEEGRVTSRELVEQYLMRIAMYEEELNATIAVSRTALEQADALDRERAEGRVRGPLHGIPIALKDIIHTTDMPTTGGALAFEGFVPPYEATLSTNLRDAGAIIIAKTVLTELANWVGGSPTPMPGNYSAVGGFGMNPYDPRRDPREATEDGRPVSGTGGSSSGIGTAANFWAGSVGTETSGSILSPSNANMLVGIKPTVGRISRYGVIPITADQDTPGPMTKWVADAAIMLGAMEGTSPDPNDAATNICTPPENNDYTVFLNEGGLQGARIGIPRANYFDAVTLPGEREPRGGLDEEEAALMAEAIRILEAQGAEIVDPADIPSVLETNRQQNLLLWGTCGGADQARGRDADCSVTFKYGMKRDFALWIASLGDAAPVASLTALRAWNVRHARAGSMKFGQSRLDISDQMDLTRDAARYAADRAKDIAVAGTNGIDAAMNTHELDALLFPASSGAGISARPGYPTVIVPFGMVANDPTPPFPDGFDAKPRPFGVSFAGMACSEPRLIEIAYAFEQATLRRVPPESAR